MEDITLTATISSTLDKLMVDSEKDFKDILQKCLENFNNLLITLPQQLLLPNLYNTEAMFTLDYNLPEKKNLQISNILIGGTTFELPTDYKDHILFEIFYQTTDRFKINLITAFVDALPSQFQPTKVDDFKYLIYLKTNEQK